MDSSSHTFTESSPTDKYAYSFITYGDILVHKGDQIFSDVYCYVAPDYNGNIVMLMTDNGNQKSVYDLSKKGSGRSFPY